MFVDVDVVSLLGIAKPQQLVKTKGRFQPAVKYSDKPCLARFRDFADNFFNKRGLDVTMESLIGSVVLDKKLQQRAALERDEAERRGWEQEHWRPADAGRDGTQRDEGACGGGLTTDASSGDASKRRKTREDSRGGDEDCSAATSGRRSAVDCGAGAADVITMNGTLRSTVDGAMRSFLAAWRMTWTWRSGKRTAARRECATSPILIASGTGTLRKRNESHWSARDFDVWCGLFTSSS